MRLPSPIRFLADRRGNVAMMYALMLPVMIFGAGFAIDYTHAMQVQTQLDAAADAAVLAGLTPTMMQQSDTAAQTAALNLFNAQASTIPSLVNDSLNPTVTVTNPNNNTYIRYITVSYTAANTNIFAGILGYSALGIAGSSTAHAEIAPNINFYLLLDNSPSMALPATSSGITSMQNATSQQGGCAFACHMAANKPFWNPSNLSQNCTGTSGSGNSGCVQNGDIEGNLCLSGTNYTTPTLTTALKTGGSVYCASSQGTQIDNFALARHNNIQLRLDALSTGITDLMTAAQNAQESVPAGTTAPVYKFAAYTLDSSWQIGMTSSNSYNNLMPMTSSYVSGWATASPNFGVMEYYGNNYACGSSTCSTDSTTIGDYATNFENAFGAINTLMPNPGNGTNVAGDTPQEILFVVTDGVADELNPPTCSETETGGRCQEPINTALCDTIKNRGIRIAILYTDYLQVTSDSWYNTWVAPFQSTIGTQLESCASPDLFYDAGVDASNLGADLQTLFNIATSMAHLTN